MIEDDLDEGDHSGNCQLFDEEAHQIAAYAAGTDQHECDPDLIDDEDPEENEHEHHIHIAKLQDVFDLIPTQSNIKHQFLRQRQRLKTQSKYSQKRSMNLRLQKLMIISGVLSRVILTGNF